MCETEYFFPKLRAITSFPRAQFFLLSESYVNKLKSAIKRPNSCNISVQQKQVLESLTFKNPD